MKKVLFVAAGLMIATSAFAGVSRGYILENRGFVFYAGLTDKNIDVQLGLERFSERQTKLMAACMRSKATHAILLETDERATEVPSGIPGRTTRVHTSVIKSVRCVPAPGFLDHWRTEFGLAHPGR